MLLPRSTAQERGFGERSDEVDAVERERRVQRLGLAGTGWTGVAHGRELNADWPEDQLAELYVEHKATDWIVENARLHFKEAKLSDFEPVGRKGRRFRHRETGREYVLDESQVLLAPDPRATGVEFFAIDGWRILFLTPRDFDPVTSRVLVVSNVVAREVETDVQPPPPGLRNVIPLRLHHDDGGQRGRDRDRGRRVDAVLEAQGIRPAGGAVKGSRYRSVSMPGPSVASVKPRTIKRTAAPTKTPPAIYSDPHFAERQREASERGAIVRYSAGTVLRVR